MVRLIRNRSRSATTSDHPYLSYFLGNDYRIVVALKEPHRSIKIRAVKACIWVSSGDLLHQLAVGRIGRIFTELINTVGDLCVGIYRPDGYRFEILVLPYLKRWTSTVEQRS